MLPVGDAMSYCFDWFTAASLGLPTESLGTYGCKTDWKPRRRVRNVGAQCPLACWQGVLGCKRLALKSLRKQP